MKTKSPFFTSYLFEKLLAGACFVLGFSGFTTCEAQSIVGKWKGVSIKYYYSAEFTKQTGKPVKEVFARDFGNSIVDYRADHTFIITFFPPDGPDVITTKGDWSLAGDQLKSTLEPVNNPFNTTTTTTIVFSGNSLVGTTMISPPGRVVKYISTLERM